MCLKTFRKAFQTLFLPFLPIGISSNFSVLKKTFLKVNRISIIGNYINDYDSIYVLSDFTPNSSYYKVFYECHEGF